MSHVGEAVKLYKTHVARLHLFIPGGAEKVEYKRRSTMISDISIREGHKQYRRAQFSFRNGTHQKDAGLSRPISFPAP